jgi:hypothetical protein
MKSHCLVIAGVSVLVFSMVSRAEIQTVVDRSEDPTASFKFANVPPPFRNDAATKAGFTIVDGAMDHNGGNADKLHDGRVPTEDDQPSENFFFQAGSEGGRLLVDLGSAIDIRQVNTYSWHPTTRGPQVYQLYASDGNGDFNARPKKGTDPDQCGWKRVAKIDTRPKKGETGGQYGVSISDSGGTIGKYRLGSEDFNQRVSRSKFGRMPFFAKANLGYLTLQGDHGQVSFRNIKIRLIEAKK